MKRLTVVLVAIAALGIAASGAAVFAQSAKPPGPVVLKGAPMGGVLFDHAKHADAKCDTCHHASKAEMPAKAEFQKCQDCHTKTATPPMKTKTQAAFHDPMAKKGLCVDCHAKDATKKAPVKCADCHKKTNV